MSLEILEPNDPTGLRSMTSGLIKEAMGANLSCVIITYLRKDGSRRTFWSGNGFECLGLLHAASSDMLGAEHDNEYEPLPGNKKGE